MTRRKTLDEMTSDDLDQLHERLAQAREQTRRVKEYLGRHSAHAAVAPADVLAVLEGRRDPAATWVPDSPPIIGLVVPGPAATEATETVNNSARTTPNNPPTSKDPS